MAEPARIHLTWFPAPSRWTTQGQRLELAWDEVEDKLRTAELWPGGGSIGHAADRLPGWSFALFRNDSRVPAPGEPPDAVLGERVEAVGGLMLEYLSDPTVDGAELRRRWGRWRFFAHSSAWHQAPMGELPAGPRWRVLLPFLQPISLEEARLLVSWARHPRLRAGLIDDSSEDPARFVPVPAMHPGDYEHVSNPDAEWLDPQQCMSELSSWREQDRQARADEVLAGTSLMDLVRKTMHRSRTPLPWPPGLDMPSPLLPGQMVGVLSELPGLRRTLALAMARTAALQGLPVLYVATAVSGDELLARLLAVDDPELDWRALADGSLPVDQIERMAAALRARAPGLHLWCPGPAQREPAALLREWTALVESMRCSGLVVVDDPLDLGPDQGNRRRILGLPLRDLANSEFQGQDVAGGDAGPALGAAVILVTDPGSASGLPLDLVLHIGTEEIRLYTSDGPAGRLPLRLNPHTGALTRVAPAELDSERGRTPPGDPRG